ncbi:unnamed protein product, partial [Effrenium voratum]
EVDEGLMEKLTTQELRERYGNNVAVASLAVLVEDSHGAKKRIIHDGVSSADNHVYINKVGIRLVFQLLGKENPAELLLFADDLVEWIGLFTDYRKYKLGLSQRRAKWLAAWTDELAEKGVVAPRILQQGLGRLGFAATALFWERPFLGPLYQWVAATRDENKKMRIPFMLRCILGWIAEKLKTGHNLQEPLPRHQDRERQITFYTDAKATEDKA